jgi:hypothetical protein
MTALIRSVLSVLAVLVLASHVASEEPAKGVEEVKRKALWEVFQKAKPKEIGEITVYAENPSLTTICFVADRRIYVFSFKKGKVEECQFQKQLLRVNKITAGDKSYNLWVDGQLEMTFASDE